MSSPWLWLAAALAVFSVVNAQQGSSLRGALEALQRRQQRGHQRPVFDGVEDYETVYDIIPPQAYADMDYGTVIKNPNNGLRPQYVIKVLDESDNPSELYHYKKNKKGGHENRKGSAFRERNHEAASGPLKELFEGKEVTKKIGNDVEDNDAEYALLLAQLWSKYKKEKQLNDTPQGTVKMINEKPVNKRYPDYWGPIAFKRKRSSGPEPLLPVEEDGINSDKNGKAKDMNYNFYEFPGDDDTSDIGEEYAIAFQPLDGNELSDENGEEYSYGSLDKPFAIRKRSSDSRQIKRSTTNKNTGTKKFRSSAGTDPKILKDLSIIFGVPNEAIAKRPVKRSEKSSSNMNVNSSTYDKEQHNHENHQHSMHTETGSQEMEKPIALAKKSVDWSQYFGIDKRKKKSTQDSLKKQYFDTFSKEVIFPARFQSFYGIVKRNSMPVNMQSNEKEKVNENLSSKMVSKRSKDDETNANIEDEKDLKESDGASLSISDEGNKLDSKEEQEMKDKLLSKLATAYSTEKMRKALKDFKQSLQQQKMDDNTNSPIRKPDTKVKRVAVKKEKVDIMANDLDQANDDDDFEGEQGAGHYVNGQGDDQFFERYMGGSGRQHQAPINSAVPTSGSCPILSKIMQRCNDVDIIAGDNGQVFLPLCSLHQICYLCGGAPQTTCDLLFLSEADTSCEGDMTCQQSARSALMTLRELHDSAADEMDGECEASPCLLATLKLNINWQRALLR